MSNSELGIRNSEGAVANAPAPGRFMRALAGEALAVPPIWMMRQAGRYHRPYQALRSRYTFETLCRQPELAAEVAMGPMLDFDFDAAILFSDLLFPLEALGFGLSYDDGPPQLDGRLTPDRLARFRPLDEALARLTFQHDAMKATRALLSPDKALLGFVGGPWTLFVYAVEGTHAGALTQAKASLDLYRAFADAVVPLLIENIRLQFEGGADIVMVFDTAAGELPAETFSAAMAPDLERLARAFPRRLGYYAKGLTPRHLALGRLRAEGAPASLADALAEAGVRRSALGPDRPDQDTFPELFAGVGLDMRWDLAAALKTRPSAGFIQGNFDPETLKLTGAALDTAIAQFLTPLQALDAGARRGWICGLGHGVLPGTPEESVRTFVSRVRNAFAQ